MKTLRFLTCFLLSLQSGICFSQSTETFHIHPNKELYLPGETIWFKTYIFNNNLPSSSTSLFAGLYDEKGQLLQEKQFPVFSGTSEGSFSIPDSIASSFVYINLFTKSTVPENRSQTYSKTIAVYQQGNTGAYFNTPDNQIMVDVVIEGGSLVAQMPNHIFFKAFKSNAAPAFTAISLNNSRGELIDSVYTDKAGTASIQLNPKAGEQYVIYWNDGRGEQKKMLPASAANGAVMHSEINGNNLYYIIQTNNSVTELSELRLLVYQGTDTVLAAQMNFKATSSYVGKMKTDSIPPGIFTMKLLDKTGKTIQQKHIYFTNTVVPAIKTIVSSQDKKGKNIIEVTMPGDDTYLLSASVSVEEFNPPAMQTSIVDELLLGRKQNGLSQLSVNKKLADQFVNLYPPQHKYLLATDTDNYLSLKINTKESIPSNAELDLIVSDKGFGKQFYKLKQTSPGQFETNNLIFYDSAKMNFQISGLKNLSPGLTLQQEKQPNSLPQLSVSNSLPVQFFDGRFFIDSTMLLAAATGKSAQFNSEQTIQNVVVRSTYTNPVTKRLMQLEDIYTTGMFKGMARGTQLNVLDDPNAQFSDPFNYILYRTGSVRVIGSFGSRVIMSTRPGPVEANEPLMLFIDENPADFIQLESIQMSRVAYIKIILGVVITGSGTASSGVIYLYTKKGNEDKTHSMRSVVVKGYDLSEIFTMPDYSSKESLKNNDSRSALYWDPNIITDKNNRVFRIEYNNNDMSKKQLLVIKGFSSNGELVEFRKLLE